MYNQNEISKYTFDAVYDIFTVPNISYIYFLPKVHMIASIINSMDPLK